MSFVSPLHLIGLSAAFVPLVIHLIGRRRAPRRKFAAIDFVLRSNRKVARRLRLRHLLLLATRMILAASVAVMMARPFTEVESELPAVGGKVQSSVIVLDDSLSMQRVYEGRRLMAHAKEKARELVQMMGGQADIAILSLSSPSGPLPRLVRDRRKVLATIESMKVGYLHATLQPALIWATRILSESSLAERHVFFISDLAAHGISEHMPNLPGLQLHLVGLGTQRIGNHAIVSLTTTPSSAPGQRMMRIEARICNYSSTKLSQEVTLRINGKSVARGITKLAPWICGKKVFEHAFQRGGTHNATVSLADDNLPADNQRFMRLEVESPLRVLLVNGDPSPIRHNDELFYLQTALSGRGLLGRPITSSSVTPEEFDRLRLRAFDVVALCNVRKISSSQASSLEAFVKGGGGLLITLGEQVEPNPFNKSLGDLLPAKLRGAVTAAPPGTGAPALRFGRAAVAHPLISPIWSDKQGGGLKSARFNRTFHLKPSSKIHHQVILWYDDGAPALLETKRGEGRILLFTSTIDRDWNDLPIRPGYLPLIQQMIRYLSRIGIHTPRDPVMVGDTRLISLPKAIRQLRLLKPTGIEHTWSTRDLGGRREIEVVTEHPGFYQLSVVGPDGVLRRLERESFVANIDPKESDLRGVSAKRGKGGRSKEAVVERAKRRIELWHVLGALLLVLVFAESFIIRRG